MDRVDWVHSFELKGIFLVNGTQCGYVRYCSGLRQGDPLSPLLFVLVVDVRSTMFNNALNFGILHGIMLGDQRDKMCHLEFADNLLVLMTGGGEDLRIIKLILFLFKGLSGLKVNFSKTCLYSNQKNLEPPAYMASTLHCITNTLPLVYIPGSSNFGLSPKKTRLGHPNKQNPK